MIFKSGNGSTSSTLLKCWIIYKEILTSENYVLYFTYTILNSLSSCLHWKMHTLKCSRRFLLHIKCNKFKNLVYFGGITYAISFWFRYSGRKYHYCFKCVHYTTTILYWFNIHYAETFEINLFREWSLENVNG